MMLNQPTFAEALLATRASCPPGFSTWNGSDPAARFAVYRNNVWLGLLSAMNTTFPVCRQWAGEALFEALARSYINQSPPQSPMMVRFGAGFAAFLRRQSLPIEALPDLAELEWHYVASFHAADAAALSHETLTALLQDEAELAATVFQLHPALRLLCAPYAIFSLWSAAQKEQPLAAVNLHQPEAVLILRDGWDTTLRPIHPHFAKLITHMLKGETFARATEDLPDDFDLASALALLIQHGALVGAAATLSHETLH